MPRKRTLPTRRHRQHGDLPAGFQWRDGRPRWEPSPTRRAQGWRGLDLKDAQGAWQSKGAAIERATAIADAVKAWAAGHAMPPELSAIGPVGTPTGGGSPSSANPRSIGVLLDAYVASDEFAGLGARTQKDYTSKLGRFLEAVAKDKSKVAALRALPIDILLPPAFGEAGVNEIKVAYVTLRKTAGESMASGVLACVSAWLAWCVREKRVWASNPAKLVKRKTPEGRIVVYEWLEVVVLVRQAEAMGWPSIGDAIALAVDLSWSQQDLLALTWGQISEAGRVKHRRIKTGNAGNPPLLALGRERMTAIRARMGAGVAPLPAAPVIVCETTGQKWEPDYFRHRFAEVRAQVVFLHHLAQLLARLTKVPAGAFDPTPPELISKTFRDLRDSAVTYCIEAGLSLEQTCSRTLHSPERAQAVISKHYGAIRQVVADEGAAKLDAHYERMGYTLAAPLPLLALPAPREALEN